jgi:hypothetical protein
MRQMQSRPAEREQSAELRVSQENVFRQQILREATMAFMKRHDTEGKGFFTRWFEAIAESRVRHEIGNHPGIAEWHADWDEEPTEGDPYGKAKHPTPH